MKRCQRCYIHCGITKTPTSLHTAIYGPHVKVISVYFLETLNEYIHLQKTIKLIINLKEKHFNKSYKIVSIIT